MTGNINFEPDTIWCDDNLAVMRGINSNCIDLIYLDPPFNSNQNYVASENREAAGSGFKDDWTMEDINNFEYGELADNCPGVYEIIIALREISDDSMKAYLIFMAVRLIEMHRILKENGSIYLHCDSTAGHYLKIVMDIIFGLKNFQSEIFWANNDNSGYKSSASNWVRGSDTILYYSVSDKFTFNEIHINTTKSCSIPQSNIGKNFRIDNVWTDILGFQTRTNAKEYLGYPTQKPLALVERIINTSSNKGDLIFDPFCGCASTLVAADRLQRKWIGCDISELAIKLIDERLTDDRGELWGKANAEFKSPIRNDSNNLPIIGTKKHELYGIQDGTCNICGLHFPFKIMDVVKIHHMSYFKNSSIKDMQLVCNNCKD